MKPPSQRDVFGKRPLDGRPVVGEVHIVDDQVLALAFGEHPVGQANLERP
ncbi:hypothetical protein JJQ59_28510 [Cupriavidus necator]|nr:hypothetical protein [Cupriavidus necator]QQX86704.1 hypothetical protein JJQ59_28510 [Cupriavidus necator]